MLSYVEIQVIDAVNHDGRIARHLLGGIFDFKGCTGYYFFGSCFQMPAQTPFSIIGRNGGIQKGSRTIHHQPYVVCRPVDFAGIACILQKLYRNAVDGYQVNS